jgi:Tfp pilus assembly protein FimT
MEMIVVVAIIGLIAGISFPSVTAGIDSVRMASATDSVSSFLNSAVNRAERHQEAVEVVISAKDNAIGMYANSLSRTLKMPDGVTLLAKPEEDPRRLILLPGATVPGLAIELTNRRGTHRTVQLDPMTGFPRVGP